MCHRLQELIICVERAFSPHIQRRAMGPSKLGSWTSFKWHSVWERCVNVTSFSMFYDVEKPVKSCVATMHK